MKLRVRALAWMLFRGHAVLQVLGLAAIAVGFGFLFSWPVGLIVAGIELAFLGALIEARPGAGTSS